MNGERRERPSDETPPRQDTWNAIWETLARAISPASGATEVSPTPEGERVTVERMRQLLGSDTPLDRPAH